MKVGILGKPSVGKSTFFSAITLIPVPISSRPFTTVKPNVGIGYIRTECVCKELNVKDNPVNSLCVNGTRLIPVELIDFIGLIPGSHKGRGLGNKFLDEIRRVDSLIHIVDISGSTDAEGNYCEPGTRDPLEDIKFLEYEVSMWLFQILKRRWDKNVRLVERVGRNPIELLERELSGLGIKEKHITQVISSLQLDLYHPSKWKEDELMAFCEALWKTSKPTLILANKIDLPFAKENIERLRKLGYKVFPCCAEAELVLRRAAKGGLIKYSPGDNSFELLKPDLLTHEQKRALELIKERILKEWNTTGAQEALDYAFFNLLDLITVYPVRDVEKLCDHEGRVLPDAFLVRKGTTTRELAYMIHEELGKNFLYAIDARAKRRLGEAFTLRDKDIVKIVSIGARG